ncbi:MULTISPECIES: ATP-binding protein [unclassified Methylophilus]|uniref:HD domain-containing protein n=1 Tax=unclassified Methylophilus TaxID=2630143 RepID=UPI00039F464C|nr:MULTISPECIES: ATP-binding protein [unclassified Methylophilus]
MNKIYDDWHAETQSRLEKSNIFITLKNKCVDDPAGNQVLTLIDEATYYAFQRTKTIVKHMGEFTLHDGDHLFRVLTLMERLLSPDQIKELSVPELMLLILSAFFHDIGMAPDEADVQAWKKFFDKEPKFASDHERNEFELFLRFSVSRPDQIDRINSYLQQGNTSASDLAKNYLISDYIRVTHADRARKIIQKDWVDKILYRDTDLTVEFANVCFSHNEDALKILELDKNYLCGPETYACLPVVAAILRLADLLDFDAKRTPSVLFSHLFVRHPVSIQEWNKHRAVEAWTISSTLIQFHAKCTHPAIQSSINAFCDIIDNELSACNNILSSLNEFNKSLGRNLSIKIPFKVDRSKIETKKMIDGKPEFLYRETQFNLSKNQVIDLLMGTKLYGDPEVALRELLQNSIDACLLREAMEHSWGNNYTPEIHIKYHTLDDEDILEIIDNGIGMDQHVIDNYYSKVGSSYYKSSDFYDLKSKSNAKFTPTSRFGIGILSCFMVADTIVVDTRKLYGPHDSSEALNLTIEGQESIFWIKPGDRKTPGTTTKLYLRKQQNPWEKMDENEFIESVENVVPNPPFRISIESKSHKKFRDQDSFKELKATSLKNYSWNSHENIREFVIEFNKPELGFIGSAVVAILESHGLPIDQISMTTKSVEIDGENYNLEKSIELEGKEISLSTTSITIDEDGRIESSNSSSRLAHSKSRISFHGIEVPSSLFTDYWATQKNQANLIWPVPILLVIDICGTRDLELNSSRTQILKGDKWTKFEAAFAHEVFFAIMKAVEPEYWEKLKGILLTASDNEIITHVLDDLVYET